MNRYFDTEEYKASEVYRKEHLDELINDEGDIYETAINDSFVAGCNWKLQQLMNGAVGGTVNRLGSNVSITEDSYENVRKVLEDFFDGDRVKLIIVKEDKDGKLD